MMNNFNIDNLPLISIIMPSYNSSLFIEESIKSIIFQTYKKWELIIVDDNSSDNTKDILNSFNDIRIVRIFLDKNVGAGLARNEGLKIAKGKIIAFLDADDLWLPHKLSTQLDFMLKNNAPICHTSYSFINENNEKILGRVNASSSLNLNQQMRTCEIGLSTAMVNTDLTGEIRFSAMRLRQDARLWIDLLKTGLTAQGIDIILVHYRISKGQISGNKFKAASRTFKLYWQITDLSMSTRLVNFLYYAFNGVAKRLKK